MKRKAIIILIGFILIGSLCTMPLTQQQDNRRPLGIAFPSQTDEPLHILGNIELSQMSSGGVGTRSDPYLFAGLNLVSAGTCIVIENTTAFFAIRGCYLESTMRLEPVVLLNNVENGLIQDCYIRGGSIGASLVLSVDSIVKDSVLFDCYNGIEIFESENCTILDCKIFSNRLGISIEYSNGSIVTNSSIYNNEDGLQIGIYSDSTRIYRNKIGWNLFNANNNGNNTEFTNGIDTGNAWSDYDGSGGYEVGGFYHTIDTFATTLDDFDSPMIDSPIDRVFDIDSTGETLTWVVSDEFPYVYLLYIDDVPHGIEIWDGREITVSLDVLSEGTHSLVMTVQDGVGNVASDEVMVTAVSFMLGGIGTELVIRSSAFTVAILILIVVIIKKMP